MQPLHLQGMACRASVGSACAWRAASEEPRHGHPFKHTILANNNLRSFSRLPVWVCDTPAFSLHASKQQAVMAGTLKGCRGGLAETGPRG